MTSNRKKFIKLLDSVRYGLKSDGFEPLTSTNELLRLYDLNHKSLNQEEINRLATAYKCPNCNCSECLNTAEEGKGRGKD